MATSRDMSDRCDCLRFARAARSAIRLTTRLCSIWCSLTVAASYRFCARSALASSCWICAATRRASAAGAAGPGRSPRLRTRESRTRHALLDAYALDTRLPAARDRLVSLEAQVGRLRTEQAELTQQLDATQRTLAVSQDELAAN